MDRNDEFLARWPTGKGEGFVVYLPIAKRIMCQCGPLALEKFEVRKASASNTSLDNGRAEVWLEGAVGPFFIHNSEIFNSVKDAVKHGDATIQAEIQSQHAQRQEIQRRIDQLFTFSSKGIA